MLHIVRMTILVVGLALAVVFGLALAASAQDSQQAGVGYAAGH
jgi:hypothetical protein